MEQPQEGVSPTERAAAIGNAYGLVSELVITLEFAKPNNRSKQDRAVAIALTDAQKLLAWIKTYCME